jgi:broad specificity phosphatase PhoE
MERTTRRTILASVWGPVPDDGSAVRPRRLLLARHGTTDWNARHIWQGHRDIPLNDLGRAQAHALAERLSAEAIDGMWTSDLSRATETAEIVGARIGQTPVVTEGLREIDLGGWEGLSFEDIQRKEPETVAALARGEDLPRGGTGERVAEFQARVAGALETAAVGVAGGTLLLVVHGGVIKALVAHLLEIPSRNIGRITAGRNASLSEIVFGVAGPQLVGLNDSRHVDDLAGPPPHDAA